ncbi:hypothetical protein GCM10010145_68900 [Streptomyces ruber]|uniref:Uncharacterized protein n=2 Tax=Streptomyces TaxID=1883 RepID=A0A918BSL8_9ACTN|nr:hypothetical protein [Streptomyces ruber]GGQ89571.1 hypothetical protein GCM10010145_68900 [Streptomyces ruber]
MIPPEFANDVASGAAGTLIGGALTGGAIWFRTKIRELARRGTAAEQDAMIAVLDDENATPEELTHRLTPLIEAHLRSHSAAVSEFKALALTGPTIYNQTNSGSGVFIGGDNHGGLTINPGGPAA